MHENMIVQLRAARSAGRWICTAVCAMAVALGGGAMAQTTYHYDELGRLRTMNDTRVNAQRCYTYDALGNRAYMTSTAAQSVSFSINDVSVSEGGTASFTVTKSGGTSLPHVVCWWTSNGRAVAGSDYTAGSGAVTFSQSDFTESVLVATTADSVSEGSETFNVHIGDATNAAILANDYDPDGGSVYYVPHSEGYANLVAWWTASTQRREISALVSGFYVITYTFRDDEGGQTQGVINVTVD